MGALLARKHILHSQARQHLGQLVFFVFVPSLTFTRLAASVDLNNLSIWWPLPVNAAISIIAGMLLGWLTAVVIEPPEGLKMHIIVATGLGNLGNMPLVIVAALCNDEHSQFAQSLGAQCNQLGIAYVIFAMWVASIALYSVAYNLLKLPQKPAALPTPALQSLAISAVSGANTQGAVAKQAGSRQHHDKEEELLEMDDELELQPLFVRDVHADASDAVGLAELGGQKPEHLSNVSSVSLQSRPRGHVQHQSSTLDSYSSDKAFSKGSAESSLHGLQSAMVQIQKWTLHAWRLTCLVITLPVASALLGLAVGCTAPIKGLLFGADPPLGFLTQSLDTMAGAMIPSMMLVLGSVLHKGPGSAKLPVKTIVGVLAARQILIPMLGTCLVLLAHKWHIFAAPDPLFLLVLLLGHTTPTAINMQTVVTIHQNQEAEMSCLLFWQYMCSVVTLPCWMLLYMHIIQQTAF